MKLLNKENIKAIKYDCISCYKIVNPINGRFYVGSTQCLKTRLTKHLRDLELGIHCNKPMQNEYHEGFYFEPVKLIFHKRPWRDSWWRIRRECQDMEAIIFENNYKVVYNIKSIYEMSDWSYLRRIRYKKSKLCRLSFSLKYGFEVTKLRRWEKAQLQPKDYEYEHLGWVLKEDPNYLKSIYGKFE